MCSAASREHSTRLRPPQGSLAENRQITALTGAGGFPTLGCPASKP
ncbi:MAG: hypothetical protein ACR2PJ_05045 [Pseudomonadales bacterium]